MELKCVSPKRRKERRAARGDWDSEWATVHQEVQPPDGKPLIDSYGKMALVLHREANGEWKVQQEMWNATPKA
jgi:ketosteroid isomerase-like protein